MHPRRQLPEEEPGLQDAVCARRQAHSQALARRARDIQAQGRRGHAETGSAAGQARLVYRQREGIASGHNETTPGALRLVLQKSAQGSREHALKTLGSPFASVPGGQARAKMQRIAKASLPVGQR